MRLQLISILSFSLIPSSRALTSLSRTHTRTQSLSLSLSLSLSFPKRTAPKNPVSTVTGTFPLLPFLYDSFAASCSSFTDVVAAGIFTHSLSLCLSLVITLRLRFTTDTDATPFRCDVWIAPPPAAPHHPVRVRVRYFCYKIQQERERERPHKNQHLTRGCRWCQVGHECVVEREREECDVMGGKEEE